VYVLYGTKHCRAGVLIGSDTALDARDPTNVVNRSVNACARWCDPARGACEFHRHGASHL